MVPDVALLVKYNYAKGDAHHALRQPQRRRCSARPGAPASAPAAPTASACLTVVESTAQEPYDGSPRADQALVAQLPVPGRTTPVRDNSDDDNERDPFTFRYADVTDLDAEYGYSDRDQRHRFNGWLLWQAPGRSTSTCATRTARRSRSRSPPNGVATPSDRRQDRIHAGRHGRRSATRGRKDNSSTPLDLRLSRELRRSARVTVEPIFEVFNLFNSDNFRRPEVTNLIFNFDGTVQSGLGDPRQVQVGLRVVF